MEQKKYNTIVIDPPWSIQMQGHYGRRPNRRQELPYKTMTLEEIGNFPLKDFAAPGAHIYLWTTNKLLKEAFNILEKWGVNYHMTITWVKPTGFCVANGYKSSAEFCLLGFYGKPMQKWIGIAELNWIEAFTKPGHHSEKPTKFYNKIKKMSPEPRIDIFSRRVIAGFDAWGDEAPKEKQREL
jgi:N6-adenosine-specific RNA methylase IME4